MWDLYARISSQWRYSFGGQAGLDYGPAIKLIEAHGWDLEPCLDLLSAIEAEWLDWNERERQKPSQD